MSGHWTWYSLVPGLEHVPFQVLCAGTSVAVILVLSLAVRRRYATESVVPDGGVTMRGVVELGLEKLLGLFQSVMGEKDGRTFFPLLGALFVYIFINNLLGLIPGFLPATENLNTNAACAITVFVFYNAVGFKRNGVSYLKHFTGPIMWLAPLMIVLEVIGHCVRPVSLSIRLFGNMTGDHMVLENFIHLTKLFVPVIFYGLGLFVCFIQALVFTLLSMIYISMATSHDH